MELVDGYGQYCPISRAADILDGRWTIPIVRDLLQGTRRFTDLVRANPRLSRALLSRRLDELSDAGLVERDDDGGYVLTPAGQALRPIVFGLAEWGARFAFGEPRPEELDPDLLVWWLHRSLDVSSLPDPRFVVLVQFRDHANRYWIVVEHEASICITDPGFDVALELRADLPTLYRVYLGRQALDDALARTEIELRGPAAAIRAFRASFRLSLVADIVRDGAAHES
jgi:DNA-binding HxlR family transcriptional regulator